MKEIIIAGLVLLMIYLIRKSYLKNKRQKELKKKLFLEGLQLEQEEKRKRKLEIARTTKQQKQEKPIQQSDYLDRFQIEYLYHMTHKNNLHNIFQNGLLSHNQARDRKLIQTDIADNQVNVRRVRKEPIYHRSIHDYVPLYFNPRNPMLYRRGDLQSDILILAIDRKLLYQPKIIFTNGNAAANDTLFFRDLKDLAKLNWNCINAEFWNNIPDGKRIKCSEVLVFPNIQISAIKKIFCNNSQTKQFAKNLLTNNETIKVEVNPKIYFDGFIQHSNTTNFLNDDIPF